MILLVVHTVLYSYTIVYNLLFCIRFIRNWCNWLNCIVILFIDSQRCHTLDTGRPRLLSVVREFSVGILSDHLNIWKYHYLTSLHSLLPRIYVAPFLFPISLFIIYWIVYIWYGLHFVNIYCICIFAMNDADSLSLGYFPSSSPGIYSPDVVVDDDGDPTSFSQCKLDSDEQSILCATFRLFKIGNIYIWRNEKIGCSFWFDMKFCCF